MRSGFLTLGAGQTRPWPGPASQYSNTEGFVETES
jgi:hypothetical protein